MKKLNNYFFQTDQISLSDALWFYGGILAMIIIGAITLWQ